MPGNRDEPTPGQLFTSGAAGVGLGCLFRWWAGDIRRQEEQQKQELDVIRRMRTSGVDEEVRSAQWRGLEKTAYAKMHGETFTSSPVMSSDGTPALAVQTIVTEKSERYEWKDGDKIYEERIVEVNGQQQKQKVDTGRRKEGQWIAREHFSRVEDNTTIAQTGLCFRELGSKDGLLGSPSPICLDLRKFKASQLILNENAKKKFVPNQAMQLNVNLGSKHQQPPSRTLGHEISESVIPMNAEVFALGDVVLRNAASVNGVTAQGAVSVLQPKPGKPFAFGFGSEGYYILEHERQIRSSRTHAKVVDAVSYGFFTMGGLAAAMALKSSL